ncbi:MAG: universal stress protein [Bacteroidales bacterium]|jgi:nucleotide-binding universal stress UspA family protein|nr:universal stress protein [Bacteroidales bacterium]
MKDIIVPINFTSDSENSLEEAVFLSRLLNSKIHLINIVSLGDWWNNMIITKDTREKLYQLSLENLKKTAALHPEADFEIKVLFGKVHEQILEYSESVHAELIILCDKHKEEKENKILGSIVTHVITEAKCPVITIKNKIDTDFKNIVVPVDLAEDADRQVNAALAFNHFAKAKLHFVSVLFGGAGNRNIRTRRKVKQIEKKLKKHEANYTFNLLKKRKTYAYQDILEYSNAVNSDLIIIMTHKERYSFDNYIGAFAHRIINFSLAPVMTITSQAVRSEKQSVVNKFVDPLGIFKPE